MGVRLPLRALLAAALLLVSCTTPIVVTPPATSPTIAPATAAPTASVAATAAAASPAFASSECTKATATTRQVIERYFALSTSNNALAVIDCFAKVWRDTHPTFADSAAFWSHAGPATDVVITFLDTVNGCDRFGVKAQMATFGTNNAFSVAPFITIGPEAGVPRIFETGTGLVNAQSETITCK